MRDAIDDIKKILILRKPRSGCLEGRTAPIQRLADFFTCSFAEESSVWCVPLGRLQFVIKRFGGCRCTGLLQGSDIGIGKILETNHTALSLTK